MRVSYIAEYSTSIEEVKLFAKESAICTHNHKEGVKGAVVTAICGWMAKNGKSKNEIYDYALSQYPSPEYRFGVDIPLSSLKISYQWDVTCQGSVPVAIRCFLESNDYKDFLYNVLSLDCDTDTLCAIGGGIAEEFYGTTGFNNDEIMKRYLDDFLYDIVMV